MRRVLVMAVVALGLGLLGHAASARGYVVNGHAASPAEVQFLASYGAQPGHWKVDGFGISPAHATTVAPASTETGGKKCWYVLDVLLCD